MQNKMVKKYFDCWNSHDTQKLAACFTDDITLKDWNIEVSGLQNVLIANQRIFDDLPLIKAEIVTIVNDYINKISACIIEIHLNNSETIGVVDIIKFDEDYNISSISAYRDH